VIAAELFCGMGMSSLGIVRAGLDLKVGVDMNPAAIRAFNAQAILPPVGVVGLVGAVPLPEDLDLLSGGPVCKAFSPGATLFGTAGKDDPRNTFPYFMAEVEKYRPRYVLIENTSGMRSFGGYVDELVGTLNALGYWCDVLDLDCWWFGIPQHRKRVVFFASRTAERWKVSVPPHRLPGPEVVGDVLQPPPAGDPWPLLIPLSPKALDYFLRDPRHAKKHPPLIPQKPASTVVSVYRKGVPYGVVFIDGEYFHCGPRLAARLQGLPDEFDLSMMVKTSALEAIGNGFPPQVVEYFAKFVQ
jgi:DNA (cytosine-5)-methyltransferase 1